jgi:hypothetical protein
MATDVETYCGDSQRPAAAGSPSFLQKNGLDCHASITTFQTHCRYLGAKKGVVPAKGGIAAAMKRQ